MIIFEKILDWVGVDIRFVIMCKKMLTWKEKKNCPDNTVILSKIILSLPSDQYTL